jgi:hypothetical protein
MRLTRILVKMRQLDTNLNRFERRFCPVSRLRLSHRYEARPPSYIFGFGGGSSRATQGSPPREPERPSIWIDQLEIALDAKRAIVVHGDLGCRH